MEFPGNATPVAPSSMAQALLGAYSQRFGHPPDRETAELLLALLFLENDHGRAVIEHNWGNISVFAGPNVDYWRPPWFDLEKIQARPDSDPKKARYLSLHEQMLAHKAPSAFRAFGDDQSGIVSFLSNVKPGMYDAAASGDPMAFAFQYWSTGYCPDQACKDSGPTFRKLQTEIRNAGYFARLEPRKKAEPPAAAPGFPFKDDAPVAHPSSPSELSPSRAISSFGLFDSKGAVSPMTREAVVLCVRRELELVEMNYFTETRVAEYWADVLHQAVTAPHPPHWCGALALFSLHSAFVGLELRWRFQSKTDARSGFLWALPRTKAPEPGDIGYVDKPYQHHFVVASVEGAIVNCIDGNQEQPAVIRRRRRELSSLQVVYFSIAPLLKASAA